MMTILSYIFYAVLGVLAIIVFLLLLVSIKFIVWFNFRRCKHCRHTMEYKGLKEDDNNGHYLFHCEYCGAWEEVPREEFVRSHNTKEE